MMHDAIVIGGSYAGLSAATYIARARRSVAVIDTGLPRNRFATHSHGFFAQDGSAPETMRATARQQVGAYPTVSFVADEVSEARGESDNFSVILASGETLEARRLVLAFGIRDELPGIPGLAERWGRSVVHCPYCHGFEFSGQRLGLLYVHEMSAHQAALISEWGPVTLYLNGADGPDAETRAELAGRDIAIEAAPITALHGAGDSLSAVELEGGRMVDIDALYTATRTHMNSPVAEQLGCAFDDLPFGRIVRTDDFQTTTIPNVFAAGDITRGGHSIAWACADGVMAGTALHRSLVF